MQGGATETVGEEFQLDLLQKARDQTLQVILTATPGIVPGMTESEAKAHILAIQTQAGAPKSWHPPQIRFGENTLLAFGKKGLENPTLREHDIYFIDIGPIFSGHEGDVGRTFVVGGNSEMLKCQVDVQAIWTEVRNHWRTQGVSGGELYAFARKVTERRGWRLLLEQANGHRIADFPHAARARGSIEGFDKTPASDRWILEIQIRHPVESYGAFYEDLLN